MVQQMLNLEFQGICLSHVRMNFSTDMTEIGHLRILKLLKLLWVIVEIIWTRIRRRCGVLYYPPANPDRLPFLRDIAILFTTRWLFDRTIFHFHAGGISNFYEDLGSIGRWFFRRIYWAPDVAIRTAESSPEDGKRLHAQNEVVVVNGIPDSSFRRSWVAPVDTPVVLYVGSIRRTRGVMVLLDAVGALAAQGISLQLHLVGKPISPEFGRAAKAHAEALGLAKLVRWKGELIGAQKEEEIAGAACLCFPTFVRSETSGVVLIEAMRAAVPVVASRWSGVTDLVQDGVNGFLVSPGKEGQLAQKIAVLVTDHRLAARMGEAGRQIYETSYGLRNYSQGLQYAFDLVAGEH